MHLMLVADMSLVILLDTQDAPPRGRAEAAPISCALIDAATTDPMELLQRVHAAFMRARVAARDGREPWVCVFVVDPSTTGDDPEWAHRTCQAIEVQWWSARADGIRIRVLSLDATAAASVIRSSAADAGDVWRLTGGGEIVAVRARPAMSAA